MSSSDSKVKIGILGAHGRMGREVAKLISGEAAEFSAAATLAASVSKGDSLDALASCDVVIDFSTPSAVVALHQDWLKRSGKLPALVIGSTGWKIDERKQLDELAKKTPVLMGTNFSTGVMALLEILRTATPILDQLGYTPTIMEAHHKNKKDAPSGTAISLQRAISPAGPGNVPVYSIRAGGVVGDHEASFYGASDKLTFGHFAQDRAIFARGAIEIAIWLATEARGRVGTLLGTDAYFKEKILKK